MSGYYIKAPTRDVGPGNDEFAFLAEDHPALAWALAGRPKDHPEGFAPPATFMLFFDSGRLKFCLSPKFGTDVLFGVVSDPTAILANVEASLREGKFEWKTRRSK